jgi:hypothetical protein
VNDELGGIGRKRSWPNLRYHPIFSCMAPENHEKSVRISGIRTKF